jgi:hypothetical protein
MEALATPLKNGYTGKVAANNPDSLLAKLVQYVAIAQRQGIRPTRLGFARLQRSQKPATYAKTVLLLARKMNVIEVSQERAGKQGKVLKLGKNAEQVKTRLGVLRNFGG